MFNLFRLSRKDEISFDIVAETGNIVAKNGNNVEATCDTVERIVQLVAFDNVASTLLLVWTGLYVQLSPRPFARTIYKRNRGNNLSLKRVAVRHGFIAATCLPRRLDSVEDRWPYAHTHRHTDTFHVETLMWAARCML